MSEINRFNALRYLRKVFKGNRLTCKIGGFTIMTNGPGERVEVPVGEDSRKLVMELIDENADPIGAAVRGVLVRLIDDAIKQTAVLAEDEARAVLAELGKGG